MQEKHELPKLEIEEEILRERLIAEYEQHLAEEGCQALSFGSFCLKKLSISYTN